MQSALTRIVARHEATLERLRRKRVVHGLSARLLQALALYVPGAQSVRVWLHRARGATIGKGTFIGTDAIIETAHPELVSIGRNVSVGIRSTIIAHFRKATPAERLEPGDRYSVVIEDDVFIGPHVLILPGVRVGRGAVLSAGSVVTRSVPSMTVVQGNPAKPVARCGVPLGVDTPACTFQRHLRPVRDAHVSPAPQSGGEERRP